MYVYLLVYPFSLRGGANTAVLKVYAETAISESSHACIIAEGLLSNLINHLSIEDSDEAKGSDQ